MVYAEFGGQTECIMGNWKIENGRHYTNTKKNTRVKSTTYSDLCLIQMLLCTLHSADLRVELIKDADTLFKLDNFIPNQRKRKSVTPVCILEPKTHTQTNTLRNMRCKLAQRKV